MKFPHFLIVLSIILVSGCEHLGYHSCDALSGWCKDRKPAAVDFWDIKNEKKPRLEDFENHLADGTISVNDGEWRSARLKYFYKKIEAFERCRLDWRTTDTKPLIETFKPEGFKCLEKNGLYRNSLSEDIRW